MKFSADKLLQQGIEAHKAGQLQDAERLYRSILQKKPDHPDANHTDHKDKNENLNNFSQDFT